MPQLLWTDEFGVTRPVFTSTRLAFSRYPGHAALRRFVFARDGYTCVECGDGGGKVPDRYDGTHVLYTIKLAVLVIDHVLSRRNGGSNHPDNLRTLCDSCNARKAATVDRNYRAAEAGVA